MAAIAMAAIVTVTAGCSTPDSAVAPTGTEGGGGSSQTGSNSGSAISTSSTSSVTQPGMLTGPGVDNSQITLGTLIDPAADRGFLVGLDLWKNSVNAAGGVCGRSITVVNSGQAGVPAELPAAYAQLGTQVLGFVTQTDDVNSAAGRATLAGLLTADQIPALTIGGTSADLTAASPVVIGPTADIIAINAVDDLVRSAILTKDGVLGVVTDGTAASANALEGVRWYAGRAGLTLDVQTASGRDLTALATLPAVLVLAPPSVTASVADGLPRSTVVVTTLDGYDQSLISTSAAAHLEIALPTPAFGSDHPGAVTVEAAFTASGATDPGPLTFAGYASGASWQRLLSEACDNQSLTRAGVRNALATVGPASVESLIGASDPGLPGIGRLPASRSSAVAQADPAAPTGMRSLTGLIVADGIEEYVPSR